MWLTIDEHLIWNNNPIITFFYQKTFTISVQLIYILPTIVKFGMYLLKLMQSVRLPKLQDKIDLRYSK